MLFFLPISVFEEMEYQTESKRNKTFGNVIFGTNVIQETWSGRQESIEEATRQGARPREGAPPTLMTTSLMPWRRVQVSWITFGEKITFPKVSFRLDSV